MLEGHFIHPSDYAEAQNKEPERDTVMVYCPSCGDRVDFKVSHPHQSGAQHQAINLLPEIATSMTWDKMDVVCKKCCLVLAVDPVIKDRARVELTVKIDCEGMQPGMESWYENFSDEGNDYDQ
jgi:RNase P subunit RPR2